MSKKLPKEKKPKKMNGKTKRGGLLKNGSGDLKSSDQTSPSAKDFGDKPY